WLVGQKFAAMGDHVERPLEEMHLVAAPRLWDEPADLGHQYRVGKRLRQHAPLLGVNPPTRCHHVDEGHDVSSRGRIWPSYDECHSPYQAFYVNCHSLCWPCDSRRRP